MQMHQPHEEYLLDEFRDVVRNAYGGKRTGPEPGQKFLVNIDRVVKLHAIVRNPYHEMVFGNLSTLDLMHVCAHQMMENFDYRHAFKALRDIHRIERDIAKDETATPAPARNSRSEPVYRLDPEAVPVQPPPLTEEELYLRSLSDQEVARQYMAEHRRDAERRGAERTVEEPAPSDPIRPDTTLAGVALHEQRTL